MENNNNPVEPIVPSDDALMPEIPSVDEITVAEMPELDAVPDAAVDAAEAAPAPFSETPTDAPINFSDDAAEASDDAAQPEQTVPVVQEYPDNSAPQYTSYVPQNSSENSAPEVYTAPVAAAPVIATPTYGTPQQPVRTVPVYQTNGLPSTAVPGHGKAVASLVLGIFSLLFSWCCCGGLIPGVIGLCLGASSRSDGNKEGIAKAGIGLNIAAIVLSILLTLGLFACTAAMGNAAESYGNFDNPEDFFSNYEEFMQEYGGGMYDSINGFVID